MITRIRRPYWVAGQLVLLGIAAGVLATGISSILESRMQRSSVHTEAGDNRGIVAGKSQPVSAYLPMARRNLYAAPHEDPEMVGDGIRQTAPAELRLLGTGGAGLTGFAIVEKKSEKKQQVVGIGEDIDGAELTAIGWRQATLRRAGAEETLVVAPDTVVQSATQYTKKSALGSRSPTGNIQELGDDRWMVAQTEVAHQLENLSTLFTQMRAVPNMKDGVANGFRIFAIRRNSLFQKLGLKNNDVVQRVNGMDLNDPARALGLLEDIKGENRLTLDVLRGNEPRTLTYEIR